MKGLLLIFAVTLFTICVVGIITMAVLTWIVNKKNKKRERISKRSETN